MTDSTRSLESELLSRPDSDAMLLAKSRDALREAIVREDIPRTIELSAFIRTRFDTASFVPLWPREWMLVHFWAGDYRRILSVTTEEERYSSNARKLTPQQDLLLTDVERRTLERTSALESRIRAAGLDDDDVDFLILFLHYVTGPDTRRNESDESYTDRINREADEVLTMHRQSRHAMFIRQYIRRVFVPSHWGGGLSFSLGPGTLSPNLVRHFTDPFMIEFTFDAAYHQFFGVLGISIGAAGPVHTQFTDTEGHLWQKDLEVNHMLVYLAAGLLIRDIGPVTLAPHAGIGYADISPPEQQRSLPGNDVALGSAAIMLGLNIDIPISPSRGIIGFGHEQGNWFIRIRPSWKKHLTSDPFLSGTMYSVTIGIGVFARPVVRDL